MTESDPRIVSPGSKTKFGWNWKPWLQANDAIMSYRFVLSSGLTAVGSPSSVNGVVGTLIQVAPEAVVGQKLTALCEITTAFGFIESRTIHLKVSNR